MKTKHLFALVAIILVAQFARAAISDTIFTYQGRLNDGGITVPDGQYAFSFRLYDDPSAGTQLGSTITLNRLPVTNGVFTVQLDFGPNFTGGPRWLDISAGPNIFALQRLSPRQQITATPYAIHARTASSANAVVAGSINKAALANDAVDSSKIANDSITTDDLAPGLRTGTFWALLGNTGTLPGTHFVGTTDGASLVLKGNNVGVNVNSPTAALHVAGRAIRIDGLGGEAGYLGADGAGGDVEVGSYNTNIQNVVLYNIGLGNVMNLVAGTVYVDAYRQNTGTLDRTLTFGLGSGEAIGSRRDPSPTQYGIDFFTGFQRRMSILNNGFVGIGITDPDFEFEVGINAGIRNVLLVNSREKQDATFPELPGIIFGNYNSGEVISSQRGTNGANRWGLDFYTAYGKRMSIGNNGNVGIGTDTPAQKLTVNGAFMQVNGGGNEQAYLGGDGAGSDVQLGSLNASIDNVALYNPASGRHMHLFCRILTLTGGADLAEPFAMSEENVEPGTVVVIDSAQPGRLKPSTVSYDRKVAGVVSGAGGIQAGLTLQTDQLEAGKNVALTGRVYVRTEGPVEVGDLLTTSDTPGHAMKATDHGRAQGAILGKAMNALPSGKGLVLVLVTLQ